MRLGQRKDFLKSQLLKVVFSRLDGENLVSFMLQSMKEELLMVLMDKIAVFILQSLRETFSAKNPERIACIKLQDVKLVF